MNRRSVLRGVGGVALGTPLLGSAARAQTAGGLLGFYSGTTTTTIQYLDAFGQPLGRQTYQNNVVVRLGPVGEGASGERNPFHLYVVPDPPSITGQEGVYEIHSALGYAEVPGQEIRSPITGEPVDSSAGGTHETTGGGLTLQYWTLQQTGQTTFAGVLSDPHTAEALAVNLINAVSEIAPGILMVWFYPIAAGTQLAGRVDGNTLTMAIAGNTIDGTRPFRSDIVATRFA